MRLGGPRRDRQALGDGLIGQPPGDQPGHLELTAGQPRPRARGIGVAPGVSAATFRPSSNLVPRSASRYNTAVRAWMAGSKALMPQPHPSRLTPPPSPVKNNQGAHLPAGADREPGSWQRPELRGSR